MGRPREGRTLDTILVLHNKGAEYRIFLPDFTPEKMSNLLWRSVDAEGNVLVSDMGRLSMFVIAQALKTAGSRLLGGTSLDPHIRKGIGSIYTLDRPKEARSLQLSWRDVLWNENTKFLSPVFRGAFFDFKTFLHGIFKA